MYIKEVIINNFKSYRDQTIITDIDKRHNIILGKNGSGKSNLLTAIEFVLSNKYPSLTPKARQQFFHSSSYESTCYVTIIFDNSDRLIAVDENEVAITRIIAIKKDDYLLNGNYAARSTIMKLLERAGFCFSNPYCIIKQGQITELILQPDSFRFKLLLEVSGINKFDKEIEKAKAILTKCEFTQEYIINILPIVKDRSHQLSKEIEEFKEHLNYSKSKSALEHLIQLEEMTRYKRRLNELKQDKDKYTVKQKDLSKMLDKYEAEIKQLTAKKDDLKMQLLHLKVEENNLNDSHQHLIKENANLDLTIKDLKEQLKDTTMKTTTNEQQLSELQRSLTKEEDQLKKVKRLYETAREKEEDLKQKLAPLEEKRNYLFTKQGRKYVFNSVEERNDWIRKELKTINEQMEVEKNLRDNLMKNIQDYERQEKALVEETERLLAEVKEKQINVCQNTKKILDMGKSRNLCQNNLENLLRKEEDINQRLFSLKDERIKMLSFSVDHAIRNGIRSVQKVLEYFAKSDGDDKNIPKYYYGLVIDNFTCNENFQVAIEVTAKNQLFNHIVENEIIATKIISEINKQKLPGIVNFMPLSVLQVLQTEYIKHKDYEPLISRINYEDKFKVVMEFLFARTMVCRTLEVAIEIARKTNFNCVTVDGDQVSSRGVLTGGFFDKTKSRFRMYKEYSVVLEQIKQNENELNLIRQETEKIKASITQLNSDICKLENVNSSDKQILHVHSSRLSLLKEELMNVTSVLSDAKQSLTRYTANLNQFQMTTTNLQNELQQKFLTQLSENEKEEINVLNATIMNLQKEVKSVVANRMRVESEKNRLENKLRNSLIPQQDKILDDLRDFDVNDCKNTISEYEAKILELDVKIKALEKKSAENAEKRKSISDQFKEEEMNLENLREKKKELEEKIETNTARLQDCATWQKYRERLVRESEQKMLKFTNLPSQDLISNYQKMAYGTLVKELEKVNRNLKKYKHVNTKAQNQYLKVIEYKDRLCDYEKELNLCFITLEDINIKLLCNRKITVEGAFQEVARNFSEIFQKLVRSGHAVLKITCDDKDSQTSTQSSLEDSDFTGIAIKVSFLLSGAKMQYMNQLSGGEKSIIILAFIFALQKYRPAPLYLLDEIDQALDVERRKSLAKLIHEFSDNSQFITSTFRVELLKHAHKFYKVSIGHNVSHVKSISKEEAESFFRDANF